MKCHYETLGVTEECSSDDLKKAYRKLALEWHPDKNLERPTEATETFQLIQQAYEILIDPQERAWYDRHKEEILRGSAEEAYKDNSLNVFQYFSASCFKGYNDDEKGFYAVYRNVFETLAAEDRPFIDKEDDIEIPTFGCSDSSYEDVVHNFYAYWQSYCTAKSYSWGDQFDLSDARRSGAGRPILRAMEKENKKVRDQQKKKRNEEVRELVAFVRKRDKRVQAHKKKEEERKIEKAKKTEELRRQQTLERNKSLENYKESEWLSSSKIEEQFNAIESTLDATFGTTASVEPDGEEEEEDALYCVACEKDFRSEKAMKNHENSKKHKENVALLKYLMEEEESALQENCEEKEVVDGEAQQVSESENEDTSEAFMKELIKNNSKSKKKKKKGKTPQVKTEINVENDCDLDLESKLEEVKIDESSEEMQQCNSKTSASTEKLMTKKKKGKNLTAGKNKEISTSTCTTIEDEEETEKIVITICETCNTDFKSRNKLFSHLKESGHAVYKNDTSHPNCSKNAPKKKKKKS